MKVELKIIVPVFNEEANIEKFVQDWNQILNAKEIAHQLILYNDGSQDNTLNILERIEKKYHSVKVINKQIVDMGQP